MKIKEHKNVPLQCIDAVINKFGFVENDATKRQESIEHTLKQVVFVPPWRLSFALLCVLITMVELIVSLKLSTDGRDIEKGG